MGWTLNTVHIYWWWNLNTLILSSNTRTSNLRPSLDLLNHSLNRLKHHFLSIDQTRTCSSFGNQTLTTYFWLQTIKHWTLNIVRPITNRNFQNTLSPISDFNRFIGWSGRLCSSRHRFGFLEARFEQIWKTSQDLHDKVTTASATKENLSFY